ncbi:MAG: rod shape-determining protein MreD [Candidatus Omnitrophota bacterium]
MKKIITVILLTALFFYIEYLFCGLFGKKYAPNLILLLIIFINLTLGIRYSLVAAALGGIIKDSFGIHFFGFYVFSFVFSAFMTTILERYILQKGSRISLLFLICVICMVNILTQWVLSMSFDQITPFLQEIFFPEIMATLIVTNFTFKQLRKCVLKFYA